MIENYTLMLPVSDSCEAVASAFTKAQAEIGHATKASVNPHFKSKYADLATIIETIRPILAKHDLCTLQMNFPNDQGVILQTVIMHKTGQWIADGGQFVPASKKDAQGTGSAMTYARRYGLAALVGVAQDDDDGNAAVESAKSASLADPKSYTFPSGKHKGETPAQVKTSDPSYIDWALKSHGDAETIQLALAN